MKGNLHGLRIRSLLARKYLRKTQEIESIHAKMKLARKKITNGQQNVKITNVFFLANFPYMVAITLR